MTTIEPTEEEAERRTGRVRSISAGVLGVLAVVILLPATVAMWARATVFNSDKVGDAVGNALAQPEVEDALAQWATDQIVTALDVDTAVKNLVPDQLSRLEPALSAGITQAVDRLMTRVMADPKVQQIITDVAERAHARLVSLLEGDGLTDGIKVVNGQVTVNMLPLIGRGLGLLQNLGLFDDLVIPDLTCRRGPGEADRRSRTGDRSGSSRRLRSARRLSEPGVGECPDLAAGCATGSDPCQARRVAPGRVDRDLDRGCDRLRP
jgi:hypothetical protein